ncbi:hypothetical protein [Nocardioides panaciterrulae]|uniref:Uncharacterized protein n=1 Tax=Nocardioides panaciterrulae TaxID=661492 RepID=A0A7Y9E8I0_9ACTN|nr:hypothetical protein [Nocardioides panaciterrulae]NYD43068.1 hypothetical protein [Nocardioides panaciterrulae]
MTTTQTPGTSTAPPRAGDVVRVRSREEILATLDANGRLDGQPFMPEMLAFAGRDLPISAIAHKTCDTISRPSTGLRQLEHTVHLAGARCDGSAHGGCQAGCLLFWREEWLEDSDGRPLRAQPRAASSPVATEETLHADTVAGADEDGATVYRCAATEVLRVTRPLPPLEPAQYVADVRSGNFAAAYVLRGLLVLAFNQFQKLSRKLLPRQARIADGRPFPFFRGTGPGTAPEPLRLQPGELVEVKSKDEIMAALGPNSKNRGLIFDGEMLPFCGRRARVLRSVDHIIDEQTGRMIHLRDCVILDEVTCMGRYHRFCPRAIYPYWREAWLRRVNEGVNGQ